MNALNDFPGADRAAAALYASAREDFAAYGRLLLSTESEFLAAGIEPPREESDIPEEFSCC